MSARLLAASVFAAVAALVSSAAVHASVSLTAPVTGSFTAPGGSGPVGGVLTLNGFAEEEGALVALGTVSYSLCVPNVDPKNCLASLTQEAAFPVTAISASCGELQLTLGPVTLISPPGLPDFTIQLDAISLDIAPDSQLAQNRLCALAHRLDASNGSGQIAAMLTQFIRLLDDP